MISHCKSSLLYRTTRIPTHTVQFRAVLMVRMYFSDRYSKDALARHKDRITSAFAHMEQELHR